MSGYPKGLRPHLTAREIAVLVCAASGMSNEVIARHLTLSTQTVKSHLTRINYKLGTVDRASAVAAAVARGAVVVGWEAGGLAVAAGRDELAPAPSLVSVLAVAS